MFAGEVDGSLDLLLGGMTELEEEEAAAATVFVDDVDAIAFEELADLVLASAVSGGGGDEDGLLGVCFV